MNLSNTRRNPYAASTTCTKDQRDRHTGDRKTGQHGNRKLYVDGHHTVEDTGIVLGKALGEALGDKSGITRYGSAFIPMDEALAFCSLDISNRPFLVFQGTFTNAMIGQYDACLTEEFFRAFAFNAGITLHVNMMYGSNDHHKCEAAFKAVAHALKTAVTPLEDGKTLSTKGVL